MAKVIGIDLGTTNSVRRRDGGRASRRSSRTPRGTGLTPSVVAVNPKTGERMVGPGRQAPGGHQPREHGLLDQAVHGPQVRRPGGAARPQARARTRSSRRRNGDVRVDAGRQGVLAARDLGDDPAEAEGRCRGLPGRARHPGGDHGPGVLQRRAAAGDQGRRPDRRPRGAAHHQRADGRGAGLRAGQEGGRDDRRLRPGRRHVRRLDPARWARASSRSIATNGDTHLGGDDFDQRDHRLDLRRVQARAGDRPAPGPHGAAAAEGGGREGEDRAVVDACRRRSTCRSSRPTPAGRST